MKKLVFASVLVFTGLTVASALRAQEVTIKDPAEYNAYSLAMGQNDPKLKASAIEDYLQKYPQSVLKKPMTISLLEAYQAAGDPNKIADAAARVLVLDAANPGALYYGMLAKRQLAMAAAGKQDPAAASLFADAATYARKGLNAPKPSDVSDADWKTQTAAVYPSYRSTMAYDAFYGRKDYKAAIQEFINELALYPAEQTTSGPALNDTLQLAQAYAADKQALNAAYYYARAYAFAPATFKAKIEPSMNAWYKKYHGGLDGIDALKAAAAASVFPKDLKVAPEKTPAEKIHDFIADTKDLSSLALADKELILSLGSQEDRDKVWAAMKDQQTPVPGVVIEATASQIKVAVTQDAKDNKVADFVVNLKEPLADKDIPAVGFVFGLQPAAALAGTYDTYVQVPASDKASASAQIVLKEGFVVAEQKKAATPARKPTAAKPAAAKKPAAK